MKYAIATLALETPDRLSDEQVKELLEYAIKWFSETGGIAEGVTVIDVSLKRYGHEPRPVDAPVKRKTF